MQLLDVADGSTTTAWRLEGKQVAEEVPIPHDRNPSLQGCCWSHGQLPLLENVQDYAVYIIGDALSLHFPGHLGGAAEADIALDDIKFLSSTCDCKLHHIIFLLQFNAQLLQAKQLPNPTQLLPRFLPQVCPHIFSKYLFHSFSLQFLQPRLPPLRHQQNLRSKC